jgi:hypothetical protein
VRHSFMRLATTTDRTLYAKTTRQLLLEAR